MEEINGQTESEPDEKYKVTAKALSRETKNIISLLLNPTKVLPTEGGLPRDWQGLAELVGVPGEQMPQLQREFDPTQKVLSIWIQRNPDGSTIDKLFEYFSLLDRFDVIDDIRELIDKDIAKFSDKINRVNDEDNFTSDVGIWTVDDVTRVNAGLDPQTYDAFVLFVEHDIDFATELIDTMEKQYNLKFCVKDRDLVGGALEVDIMIKLISERCNRLIVIISDAFLKSNVNNFFVSFAQSFGIERRQRKIIPCLYSQCKVPPELSCYYMLDYRRSGKLWNFWDKLHDSIKTSTVKQTIKQVDLRPSQDVYIPRDVLPATPHHEENTLKPKKEGVKFNSMVNLENENILVDSGLNPSTSSNSLSAITSESKKQKTKVSWLKKILNKNKSGESGEKESKKKPVWLMKRKIAIAN